MIGGLSLGGYLALAVYRQDPDVVCAVIVWDSGPGYRNAEAREMLTQCDLAVTLPAGDPRADVGHRRRPRRAVRRAVPLHGLGDSRCPARG